MHKLVISDTKQCQLFGLFQRLHTYVEAMGVDLYIAKRRWKTAEAPVLWKASRV